MQLSAALPERAGNDRAVGIPLDFIHAPSAKKPNKKAPQSAWDEYKVAQKQMNLCKVASDRLNELSEQLTDRKIICAVDGGYTNKTFFRDKGDNVSLIGRIRKDACLYKKPEYNSRGRRKYYGDRLPTPEQIRQSDEYPWQQVEAFAAGKLHVFDIKTLSDIRWKGTGGSDVRLVIIRPLAYRPRKGAKLLYRDPAYLLCDDPALPLDKLLQSYLWRWEIEVNFRDEKHIFGVGDAQVRNNLAVETVPPFVCAAYSFLLLAGMRANCNVLSTPRPLWYPAKPDDRCSTQQLIALFRSQLWGLAINEIKSNFANTHTDNTKPFFLNNSLESAVCHARKS